MVYDFSIFANFALANAQPLSFFETKAEISGEKVKMPALRKLKTYP
jgi:hypothetical protein